MGEEGAGSDRGESYGNEGIELDESEGNSSFNSLSAPPSLVSLKGLFSTLIITISVDSPSQDSEEDIAREHI